MWQWLDASLAFWSLYSDLQSNVDCYWMIFQVDIRKATGASLVTNKPLMYKHRSALCLISVLNETNGHLSCDVRALYEIGVYSSEARRAARNHLLMVHNVIEHSFWMGGNHNVTQSINILLLCPRLGSLLWRGGGLIRVTDEKTASPPPSSSPRRRRRHLPFLRLPSTLQHNSHKLPTLLAILSGLIVGVHN